MDKTFHISAHEVCTKVVQRIRDDLVASGWRMTYDWTHDVLLEHGKEEEIDVVAFARQARESISDSGVMIAVVHSPHEGLTEIASDIGMALALRPNAPVYVFYTCAVGDDPRNLVRTVDFERPFCFPNVKHYVHTGIDEYTRLIDDVKSYLRVYSHISLVDMDSSVSSLGDLDDDD